MENLILRCQKRVREIEPIRETIKISSIRGSLVEVILPKPTHSTKASTKEPLQAIHVGGRCAILAQGYPPIAAEIVAMNQQRLSIMAMESLDNLPIDAGINLTRQEHDNIGVGEALIGRVIDSLGKPLDQNGPIFTDEKRSFFAHSPHVLTRSAITEPFHTGVRSIDSLLTVGKGQRLGIFAGTGVGKSTLLSMIAHHSESDVAVVALIGERGREVNDFITDGLGAEGLKKTIIVVSSPDDPPLRRIRAAYTATTIAEYFRDQGKSVMLSFDSLTRLAYAQREIGLLRGEPPASRGYPPSVFSMLNQLLERAGTNEHGSITAFYNILVEGDDLDEPISDAIRGILDGHIVLSRKLAERGHFPAINIPQSISRLMRKLQDKPTLQAAETLRSWIARYEEMEDLINIGAYVKGSDPLLDQALEQQTHWINFLKQDSTTPVDFRESQKHLQTLCSATTPTP